MIVTCPACSVRYLVDPRALGAAGRTVRCARCAHTWRQVPSEDMPPPLPAAAEPLPVPPPQPEPPPRVEPAAPSGRAPVARPEQRIGLPAIPRPRRRWGPVAGWAAVVIVIAIALGYGIVLERGRIVAALPRTAPLFALAGLTVNEDAGIGLEFRNVTTSRDSENGQPTLVVAGEVANVSSVARPVPKLVVSLRDRDEHELQDWTVDAPVASLAPGASVPFHTSVAHPAEEAAGVVVTFAGSGG